MRGERERREKERERRVGEREEAEEEREERGRQEESCFLHAMPCSSSMPAWATSYPPAHTVTANKQTNATAARAPCHACLLPACCLPTTCLLHACHCPPPPCLSCHNVSPKTSSCVYPFSMFFSSLPVLSVACHQPFFTGKNKNAKKVFVPCLHVTKIDRWYACQLLCRDSIREGRRWAGSAVQHRRQEGGGWMLLMQAALRTQKC